MNSIKKLGIFSFLYPEISTEVKKEYTKKQILEFLNFIISNTDENFYDYELERNFSLEYLKDPETNQYIKVITGITPQMLINILNSK